MEIVGPSDATDSLGDNDGMLAPLKRDTSQRGRSLQNVDPGVEDMYTRLLSANLVFDSEHQHVFCCAPDECISR